MRPFDASMMFPGMAPGMGPSLPAFPPAARPGFAMPPPPPQLVDGMRVGGLDLQSPLMTADEEAGRRGLNPHAQLPQVLGPGQGAMPPAHLTAPGYDYRGQQLPSRQQIEANTVPFMMQLPNPVGDPQNYLAAMSILTGARQHAGELYNQLVGGQNDYTRGLLSEGRLASQGQQDLQLRRDMGMSGGVPTSLLQTQLSGQNALDVTRLQNQGLLERERLQQGGDSAKFVDALLLGGQQPGQPVGGDRLASLIAARANARKLYSQDRSAEPGAVPPAAPATAAAPGQTPEQQLRDNMKALSEAPSGADLDAILRGTAGPDGKMQGGAVDPTGRLNVDALASQLSGRQNVANDMPAFLTKLLNSGVSGGRPAITKAVEEALLRRASRLGGGQFGPLSVDPIQAGGMPQYHMAGPGIDATYQMNVPSPPLNPLALLSGLLPPDRAKLGGEATSLAQLLAELQKQPAQ